MLEGCKRVCKMWKEIGEEITIRKSIEGDNVAIPPKKAGAEFGGYVDELVEID
jgi:hypothetical protein